MPKAKTAQNNMLVELHVPDFEKVKKFYKQLGFRVVWERKPEGEKSYLVMKKDNNVLCFWPGNENVWKQSYFRNFPKNTKRGYAVEIVIIDNNIEKLYKKCKKFAKIVSDLRIRPWGLKDFRIEDPFGFYLRITEPHDVLDRKYAVK